MTTLAINESVRGIATSTNNISFRKPQGFKMRFEHHGNTVGMLWVNNDGKLEFEGDLDKSARLFVEAVKEVWNEG